MRVSVVIPTYNRSHLLRQTLPALMGQQADGLVYEVIFVNNGSSDQTDAVLQQACAQHPGRLRYFVLPPTGGPSAPRNIGIRAATGEIVIILDDDVLPDPDLVLRHLQFHRQHPEPCHAALGEAYVPPHLLKDPMSLFHSFPYHEARNRERLSYLHFWTCNVSFKRQFMLDHGMFDERFLLYEDVVCGHKLEQAGMHLHFCPAARGQHLHHLDPADVAAKAASLGHGLYTFVEYLPSRELDERFGLLTPRLRPHIMAKRLLSRSALLAAGARPVMASLRFLGATNGRRSRISDIYYGVIFRRSFFSAFNKTRRDVEAGRWIPPSKMPPITAVAEEKTAALPACS